MPSQRPTAARARSSSRCCSDGAGRPATSRGVTDQPATQAFPRRFLGLLAEAGWRIVLHVLPYAVACGVITEGTLRLRLTLPWKLPMVALVVASLFIAVLLGAHVATSRIAAGRSRPVAPIGHLLRMAWRISVESATVGLIAAIAALALVGLLDVAVMVIEPAEGAVWPQTVLRSIGTLAGLSVLFVVLIGGTALARSTYGAVVGFAEAGRRLFSASERTTAVICIAIAAGTVFAIIATRLSLNVDAGPPIIAAALAKAIGFLAAILPLSVGSALIADER